MVGNHAVNVTSPCVFIDTLPLDTCHFSLHVSTFPTLQTSDSEKMPLYTVSLPLCLCVHECAWQNFLAIEQQAKFMVPQGARYDG